MRDTNFVSSGGRERHCNSYQMAELDGLALLMVQQSSLRTVQESVSSANNSRVTLQGSGVASNVLESHVEISSPLFVDISI